MAKGKPTLFKKKGKPTQKQNIELAPRQKINSKSLEDIEKKIGGHRQKKRTEEKTTPSKRTQKLGNVSPRRSGGRKTKTVSRSRPLGYATYGCSCGYGKHSKWKVHRRPLRLGGKQKAEIKTPSTCNRGRRWQK